MVATYVAAADDAVMEPLAVFDRCCRGLRAGDPAAMALLPELERHPECAPGWERLGDTLADVGHPAAAIAYGRAAAAVERAGPDDPRHRAAAGQLWRRAGRLPEAEAAFSAAVRLDPDRADAWFALGLVRQDRAQDAEPAFAEALRLRPDWHEAALNLGIARQEAGRIEPALDAYAVAFRTRPDSLARIAQSLVSGPRGLLFLNLGRLATRLARA